MKTKHFILSLLTLLASIRVFAVDYDFVRNDIYYIVTSAEGKTVEVTESVNSSYSGDITIPSSVTYMGITYTVTSIGGYAFFYCSSLTSITIPSSVTSIGEYNQEIKGKTNVEIIPVSA